MNLSAIFTAEHASHFWAWVGKATAAALLWFHAKEVIDHWEFGLVLLTALIVPSTFEKIAGHKFDVPVTDNR